MLGEGCQLLSRMESVSSFDEEALVELKEQYNLTISDMYGTLL